MRLQLELDEAQENFVVLALMAAATEAWNASVSGDVDADEHTDECRAFWDEQLRVAESVLGQFSAQVMDSWRHMLGHSFDDDDDELDEPAAGASG